LGLQVNIDVTAESTSPKEKEVDFFADHVTSVKNLGDSTPRSGSGANLAAMASSTPPRVDSGSKLNSMAQNGSSGNLTISTGRCDLSDALAIPCSELLGITRKPEGELCDPVTPSVE